MACRKNAFFYLYNVQFGCSCCSPFFPFFSILVDFFRSYFCMFLGQTHTHRSVERAFEIPKRRFLGGAEDNSYSCVLGGAAFVSSVSPKFRLNRVLFKRHVPPWWHLVNTPTRNWFPTRNKTPVVTTYRSADVLILDYFTTTVNNYSSNKAIQYLRRRGLFPISCRMLIIRNNNGDPL